MLFFLALFPNVFLSKSEKRQQIVSEQLWVKHQLSLHAKTCRGQRYILLVSKTHFKLFVSTHSGKILMSMAIAYGDHPDRSAKIHEGDRRTPEGVYKIQDIWTLAAPKQSRAYTLLAELNARHLKAEDGAYRFRKPDQDIGKSAFGPRFLLLDYPNSRDRKRYDKLLAAKKIPPSKTSPIAPPGFGIAIHGTNEPESIGFQAGAGCVRLSNQDIIRLDPFVRKERIVIISH